MKKFTKVLLGILYWIVSLTWGCLSTIPGLIVTAFCIVFLHGKPHRNGYSYIVEVGGNWGGLEFGAVALCGNYYGTSYYDHIRCHEFGHSIQTLIFGPLQYILVTIPSAIRYWVFTIRESKGKRNPAYDSIWFEGTATKWGTTVVNYIENN